MQEKHALEIALVRDETESLREKLKSCQAENERIINSFK